jgi:hypothetical protein
MSRYRRETALTVGVLLTLLFAVFVLVTLGVG